AERHPKEATIERSVKARGRRIYVDYMQNALGKTLASPYSARASEFAGVSTPLTWDEVDEGVSPRDFTVANFDQRITSAGDPWAALRKTKSTKLTLRELRTLRDRRAGWIRRDLEGHSRFTDDLALDDVAEDMLLHLFVA